MLVLTRKTGESIVVDGNVHVKVLEVSGSRVKLGVDAPRHVSIFRKEVDPSARKPLAAGKTAVTPEAVA